MVAPSDTALQVSHLMLTVPDVDPSGVSALNVVVEPGARPSFLSFLPGEEGTLTSQWESLPQRRENKREGSAERSKTHRIRIDRALDVAKGRFHSAVSTNQLTNGEDSCFFYVVLTRLLDNHTVPTKHEISS